MSSRRWRRVTRLEGARRLGHDGYLSTTHVDEHHQKVDLLDVEIVVDVDGTEAFRPVKTSHAPAPTSQAPPAGS